MNLILKWSACFGMIILIKLVYEKMNKRKSNYPVFAVFLYISAFPYRGLITLYLPEMDTMIDLFLFVSFLIFALKQKITIEPYHFIFILGFITATVLFAFSSNNLSFIITTPDTRFMLGMLILCTFILSSIDSEKGYFNLMGIFYYNAAIISIIDIPLRPFLNNFYGISEYMQIGKNFMAIYLFFGLLFGLYINKFTRGVFSWNKVLCVAILFDIVLLQSSTIYIMMLATVIVIKIIPMIKVSKKVILWGVCILLICSVCFLGYLALAENGESNQVVTVFLKIKNTEDIFRLMIWKDAIGQFLKNRIFGIGANNFRDTLTKRNFPTHNDYFRLLVETGIVGFGCFIVFSYKVFQLSIKITEQRDKLFLFAACVSVYIFIMFHGYINYLPFYIVTLLPFIYAKIKKLKSSITEF